MGRGELLRELERLNPDALLLEPREVYDAALIGITDEPGDHWSRPSGVHVAVYSVDLCISAIMEWMSCSHSEAVEWFSFNTSGAWAGDCTPTFSGA